MVTKPSPSLLTRLLTACLVVAVVQVPHTVGASAAPSATAAPTATAAKSRALTSFSVKTGPKLVINVNPNLRGSRNWRVVVHRQVGDGWRRVCKCRTKGRAEILRLAVPAGTYRVRVLPRKGYRSVPARTVVHQPGLATGASPGSGSLVAAPGVAPPAGVAQSPTPTPTPTPAPTGSVSPSADTRSAWARGLSWYQANTGVPAGTTLTPSGSITVTTAGTVLDGLDVTGTITVKARNVTIRNTRVRGTIVNTLNAWDQNLLIDHVEVDVTVLPVGSANKYAVNSFYGTTLRNARLHGMSQGIAFAGHVNVYDSWIYGIRSNGTHSEAILSNGDSSAQGGNATIARNWLDADSTYSDGYTSGALCLYGDFGQIKNITIDANHLTGDGYLLYPGAVSSKPYPLPYNVTVTNNTFDPKGYGPVYPSKLDTTSTNNWANNRYTNGTLIPAPTGNA